MKLLLLHMRFHPDVTGTAPLVTALATDLVSKGVEVTVMASEPHYGVSSAASRSPHAWLQTTVHQGVRVCRTRVHLPRNAGGWQRSLNYLSYNLLSTVGAVAGGRHDVCLAVTPPITVGVTGMIVRFLHGTPLVFVSQDVWPDCLVAIGQLRNRAVLRVFQSLERMVYRTAARVVVVSQGMKEHLVEKGVPAGKLAVIPNWADVNEIELLPRNNDFRERYRLNGEFVVLFAGNIGFNSQLDIVLDAADLLRTHEFIRILIVGEGNAKPDLMKRAAALRIDNLQFLPRQPQAEVSRMLAACDLGLVTLNGKLGRLNVPSKTYPIMASARPVLASVGKDSEVYRLIRDGNCGFWVPPDDGRALADAIVQLAGQPERLQSVGLNGRRYVEANFTRARGVERYYDLLREVKGC